MEADVCEAAPDSPEGEEGETRRLMAANNPLPPWKSCDCATAQTREVLSRNELDL